MHLLKESKRILLPDGKLFASGYLLDGAAIRADRRRRGDPVRRARAARRRRPDGTRAQDEEWLLDRVAEVGFKTVGIRHGTWSGRADGRSTFDILVARM